MSQPKFKVGDIVDVRGNALYVFSGVTILNVESIQEYQRHVKSDGSIMLMQGGYYYRTDGMPSDGGAHEMHVFPHNPPADEDFTEELKGLLNPVKRGEPA